jgi:hypothetical protein
MTMTLIETKTLGSTTSLVEFVSIPQSFTDLVILISGRSTASGVLEGIDLRFNSSTSDRTGRRLWGNGASATNDSSSSIFVLNGDTSTANTFSNVSIYIPNYAGATNKSFSVDGVMETNATTSYMGLHAGLWSNTAAITSIGIGPNLMSGSVLSLYGILKGTDGIVVVS